MEKVKLKTKIPSFNGYVIQKIIGRNIFKLDKANKINPIFKELTEYKYKAFELNIRLDEFSTSKIELSNCRGYMLKNKNNSNNKIVYQLHGGAYINPISDNICKSAVLYTKYIDSCDLFCLDYRVASQNPYPAALDDALEGYNYLLNNGYTNDNIIIAGHSAGSGLAISLVMLLRDKGISLPKCLILASPWADLSQKGLSYKYNRKKDVLFGSKRKEAINELGLPTLYSNELYNPYVSPVYGDFKNLPPMLIQCGSYEMLLSDSIAIKNKMEENGNKIKLNVYKAMWHDFYTKRDDFKEASIAWKEISDFVKEV